MNVNRDGHASGRTRVLANQVAERPGRQREKEVRKMPEKQEIICIICPSACVVTITLDNDGNVSGVANNLCKEGKKYAIAECKFPGRTLTTTIPTEGSTRKLLPVRTNRPVPKGQIMDCMHYISKIKVKPPVKMGQVVVPDIAATGVDLVASDDLSGVKSISKKTGRKR